MTPDIAELRVFAPGASPRILAGVAGSWRYAEEAGINTPLRICHFLAQAAHESDGFRTTEEYGGPAYFEKYNGRKDLGNTQAGDGPRFKGRGIFQLTGRANYRAFTVWLRKRLPSCPDFEANPALVSEFPWAFLTAVWFWESRGLSSLADRNDIRSITKAINGGYNGLADRRARFRKATDIWSAGLVNPNGSSFGGTRAVKGSVGFIGGGLTLAGLSDQVGQASAIAGGTRAISDATGLPLWGLVLGVCLLAGIAYLIWDRRFIYRHEGL